MKEINALNSVKEFHVVFNHLITESPEVPSLPVCELRIALLKEEVDELMEAFSDKDIIAIADALMDIQYVLSGAILSCGLGNIAQELFNEVHRSNMSKLCCTMDETITTMKFYEEKGVKCSYEKIGERYHVFKLSNRKTLKSICYSPANLISIIEKHD